MRTLIEMAHEVYGEHTFWNEAQLLRLKAFAELVRADEREAFNKKCQQYADWLDEAAADIEDWGMYASEYLQKKWDLPDQVQEYKNRAAAIRARGNI